MKSPWWKKTSIYQIYPWSFCDSNGDGIGDLQGIISHLDDLQELGVETIWFSPFYLSPGRDHGYDISDYLSIDPRFGTKADFDRLVKEIHKRKMKIVLDMVMNHTSDEHLWFQTSKSSRKNPKRDFYIWKEGQGKRPPNNWKSMVGGSGWQYDAHTNEYYYTNFLPFQPDLNYRNPEVKKQMFAVLDYWLKQKVDGFRLDIFNSIFKDELYRDNPKSARFFPSPDNHDEAFFQKKTFNLNLPESFQFAKEVRKRLSRYAHEPFLIGEVSGSDTVLKSFLGERSDGLHLVFQFELIHFQWKASFFRNILQKNEQVFPSPYMPVYVYGNHDQRRYIDRIQGNPEKAKVLSTLQFFARGIPVIYYGEEIARKEGRISNWSGQDPIAKRNSFVPLWLSNLLGIYINRDNCRLPMLWDNSKNAGFSKGTPWLPLGTFRPEDTVEVQKNTKGSLWQHYQILFRLRKLNRVFTEGSLSIEQERHPNVLVFERKLGKEKVFVLLSFSETPIEEKWKVTAEVLHSFGAVEKSNDSVRILGIGGIVWKHREIVSKPKPKFS